MPVLAIPWAATGKLWQRVVWQSERLSQIVFQLYTGPPAGLIGTQEAVQSGGGSSVWKSYLPSHLPAAGYCPLVWWHLHSFIENGRNSRTQRLKIAYHSRLHELFKMKLEQLPKI